ncbi:agglutinin biogenesis protein MshQ [Alteromonas sp. 1_MG-2023]|uniref:DUF6701 domain-containing protein n=1 Tax=Alteromonas sp. 1_MG-2023 TaxID=3062669 RepID=UPI0026E40B0E|nr:DUF6701 domain-containing protein [Alteromonas sp. 1_MG-2023]MDO6566700.1 agglutinin biogenesis protein MshQ [Alteromonas sp. 1_MG-2023]
MRINSLLVSMMLVLTFSIQVMAVPQIEGRFIELQNTYNKAEWTTISFSQVYDEAPAVFMLSTNQGGNPAIVKIRNVTRTGFEALPLEPSGEDGPHITMGGHYLAIAYGVHEFPDDVVIEVAKMELGADTIQAAAKSDWPLTGTNSERYAQVNFENEFSEQPTFFHSIQTVNNQVNISGQEPPNKPQLPFLTVAAKWDFKGSNGATPSATEQTYFMALEASETQYEAVTRTETVAYMATTEGSARSFFDDDGKEVEWEAFFVDNKILGYSDACRTNNFRNNYDETPLVAASKISRNEDDGGWLRSCNLNSNRLGLRVDEDRYIENERNHVEEEASIIAMTSEFVFSGDVPSCEVVFPGTLAAFSDSEIFLSANSRIIDDNNGQLTTIQYANDAEDNDELPLCGDPGVACFASNTNALTDAQLRAIPSITIEDTGPTFLPTELAGDYFFKRDVVTMEAASYNVVAPTRIYVADADTFPDITSVFTMANTSITVSDGAYLAIYVEGDVVIDATNPYASILATGGIRFVNISGETITGNFTGGGGVTANAALVAQAGDVPSNIPGICGREVIEVLNHYRFELADAKGSSCAAKSVTLKACADVDCDLLYSQPSTVGLLPLNSNSYQWSPDDSVTFIGQVSLTLDSLKGNDPELATSGEDPSSQLRCFIGGSEVALAQCDINFEEDGLTFTNITDDNETIVTQLSGKPSDEGYNRKTYAIEACANTDTLKNNTVDVSLNYTCASSSSCSNKLVFSNDGNDHELGTSAATYQLAFDNDSRAEFTIQYPDAGEISLAAEVSVGSGVSGSSNTFIVRPFGFDLAVRTDNGSADNSNALATNSNGSVLKRTGEDFVFQIRPTQWVDGEDDDNDGVPDDFAELSNNITAKHYSGTVDLTTTAILPSGGVVGTLDGAQNGIVFDDDDSVNTALNYDEVGTITIAASSRYLSSETVLGEIQNVGRFAPSNFLLSGDVLTGCDIDGSTLTYFDQPLQDVSFVLQAVNHNNERMANYRDGFDKLTNISMLVEDSGTQLNRLINVDAMGWLQSGATGQIDFSDTNITFTRLADAELDGAYLDASLILSLDESQLESATVNNSVCSVDCTASIDTGLAFAYGRATLINNYGSESEDLLLPLQTQYYDGADWRMSTQDNCTAFDHANVDDVSSTLTTSETGTLVTGAYDGRDGIRVSSPTGEGIFPVEYNPSAWLLWDWDGDGTADEPPEATLTFGAFRGNDNIIYKREKVGN